MHLPLGPRPVFLTGKEAQTSIAVAARHGTVLSNGPPLVIDDLSGQPVRFNYSPRKADKPSGKVVHLPNEGPLYRK